MLSSGNPLRAAGWARGINAKSSSAANPSGALTWGIQQIIATLQT